MLKDLLLLWLLISFATPPKNYTYAFRCDSEWRAGHHIQEPSNTPTPMCIDMQEAVMPDSSPMCLNCRNACGIILGEIPFQGATLAQVVPRHDQWDYG